MDIENMDRVDRAIYDAQMLALKEVYIPRGIRDRDYDRSKMAKKE